MKGLSQSELTSDHLLQNLPEELKPMYERIWDEADYVIPPSESNAFFVMTNVVITPNQTRSQCPEDHLEIPKIICGSSHDNKTESDKILEDNKCVEKRIFNYKSHGPQTGRCVISDRDNQKVDVCEISAWCPIELDILPLANESLIKDTDRFTVLIKNSISFPGYGSEFYRRNNMPDGICIFSINDPTSHLCPIFRLGDIVKLAGGRKF